MALHKIFLTNLNAAGKFDKFPTAGSTQSEFAQIASRLQDALTLGVSSAFIEQWAESDAAPKVGACDFAKYMVVPGDYAASSIVVLNDSIYGGQPYEFIHQNLLSFGSEEVKNLKTFYGFIPSADGMDSEGRNEMPGNGQIIKLEFVEQDGQYFENYKITCLNGPKNSPDDDPCTMWIGKGSVIIALKENPEFQIASAIEQWPDYLAEDPNYIYLLEKDCQVLGTNAKKGDLFAFGELPSLRLADIKGAKGFFKLYSVAEKLEHILAEPEKKVKDIASDAEFPVRINFGTDLSEIFPVDYTGKLSQVTNPFFVLLLHDVEVKTEIADESDSSKTVTKVDIIPAGAFCFVSGSDITPVEFDVFFR